RARPHTTRRATAHLGVIPFLATDDISVVPTWCFCRCCTVPTWSSPVPKSSRISLRPNARWIHSPGYTELPSWITPFKILSVGRHIPVECSPIFCSGGKLRLAARTAASIPCFSHDHVFARSHFKTHSGPLEAYPEAHKTTPRTTPDGGFEMTSSSFRRFSVSGASRVDATKTRTEDLRETSRLLSSLDLWPAITEIERPDLRS